MDKLADFGFLKSVITETIVTTYNQDGLPNAAPMGAIMKNEKHILVRPYTSSVTYRNLQSKKCAVINITSNPEVFYKTAFKEASPDGKVPKEWFEKAETVDAPRLQIADAIIEISIEAIRPISSRRTEAVGAVKLIKATNLLPQVYCRALFATVEAIIHATRVKVFLAGNKKKKKQALKLLETIRIYRDVVHHVAPDSRYSEIMVDLTRMLDSWRGEK